MSDVDLTGAVTHLSLCSGYEGLGLGLRGVFPNLREIAYVEREGFPVANLVAKMEAGELDAAPVFTDVKTFPYGKFRGCVDILSGGFPCQPFSQAGKRQATEDPRHLFPFIAKGIRECRPTIVFLENVEGIISAKTADEDPVLQYVLRTLEGLGYRAEAGIFSASEVGAPHQRKRVFIPGYSTKDGCIASEKSRGKLADHHSQRIAQHSLPESVQAKYTTIGDCGFNDWPARPSEPQHEWEEPRVVADTESQQGASGHPGREQGATCESEEGEPRGGHSGSLRESNGSIEPELGGATDGAAGGVDAIAHRVDRLRLLGNGVVPATAERAFRVLFERICIEKMNTETQEAKA